MAIHAQATYRDGALHLTQPLGLPENSAVNITVVPATEPTRDEIIAMRPTSPRLTVEEFHRIIDENAVHVGTLPVDFSREDIYSDHD